MENKNAQLDDSLDNKNDQFQTHTWQSNMGKWVAIVSFVLGTIIFISAFMVNRKELQFIFNTGLFFIYGAFIVNLIVFIIVIASGSTASEELINQKMALRMLLNIPIVFLYIFLIGSNL